MKRSIIFLAVLLLSVGVAVLWWKNGGRAQNPADKNSQIFVVARGDGVREIANNLKIKGLIKDPVIFFLQTKRLGLDRDLEAGDFRLSPSMSLYDIIQNLTHGTLDIWVTIPEGIRAEEIASILKRDIPSYKPDWRETLATREGYLFPDTYLIPRDADLNLVMSLLTNNFANKYNGVNAEKTGLSQKEIVTIASLVEREAKFAQDRPLVASVILNRLDLGMKLDIDATVQYALGYAPDEKRWWKKDLTIDDLNIKSPYNTYKNPGLPPSPISNPGLSSIMAVINPSKTNYLFYISDKSGHLHFAKTIEEHNANIQKYGL
ncbi:MAG: hypothetical protein A3H50_02025 [Candidatus Levybacteria bacterium RIFCSPLOWO2_02_FULL_37_10]|nr:MAG: hypothetical protein A2860_00915 [Candidatus Levybacteria bacterium RIFCSPHIGHO2_01_FULL_37_33]OGH16358.1 MAG: hypothetical protein A3C97_00020 [Candidatus Levybacteria bacterium RIFCSPHIGHO2_02_FULL_37_11]OGH29462.1 MAG: hypothetical protein A3F30_03120 [Candidatus Levybacteria bacterium RIFCSPHIGHO2_12_FULL_37_12]OGH32497.1 MAG: hypothetical protein A2953_02470 [Candidatus Levybacteria bacterium RIFCSPLOWO2_01_FULL_36_54]OGH45771.1 MAG: hypothetical protein A3H50_02025 [Candidatus Lev